MDFELCGCFGSPVLRLGWLAARIDIKQLLRESGSCRARIQGPQLPAQRAADKRSSFIEVVKVDPETVELHFALGSLFRRRGETERAIRMHRNLLERPDLGGEQRLHAMVELGQDYLKAGFSTARRECSSSSRARRRAEALKFLLEIYQQERTG